MKKFLLPLLFTGISICAAAQDITAKVQYALAFDELHQMLKGEAPISFKRAVFLTENAYVDNALHYEDFCFQIDALVKLAKAVAATDGLDYTKGDRNQVLLAGSVYRVMKDSLTFISPDGKVSFRKDPFTYDMEDFWGEKDWTKMFVTKLLYEQTGNCHSLPALYKIIADELGVDAWLGLAPNHTYIKQWSDKTGWYNTELTTGRFPYDAELKYNSYIKTEAIAAGVYMDTLSANETIAYTITDLAQGYVKKFGYENVDAPLSWLNVALTHYPNYPNALILRAELLKKQYEQVMKEKGVADFTKLWKDPALKSRFAELEKAYYTVHQIGYRRMPKEMYLNWLFRVQKDTTRKPHKFDAPQPFQQYNYKVVMMTAGDGENYEFFDQEKVVRIGTVDINRLTGKIVKFIEPEKDDMPDEVISRMYDPTVGRFWQVDRKADHPNQVDLSPYSAFWNNPIRFNDPDGECPWCPEIPRMIASATAYFSKLSGATQRLASGTSGRISSDAPVPNDVRQLNQAMGTLNDTKVVAQAVVDAGEGAMNVVASIPGVETAGDVAGTFYYGAKGDYTNAGISGISILLPGISGSEIRAVKGFASDKLLTGHFEKHAAEFGDKFSNAGEYLKGAQEFFKTVTDDVVQYVRKNGDVVQYNVKTNEFGAVTQDGTIRTFFKPERGNEYFKDQLKKELQ